MNEKVGLEIILIDEKMKNWKECLKKWNDILWSDTRYDVRHTLHVVNPGFQVSLGTQIAMLSLDNNFNGYLRFSW